MTKIASIVTLLLAIGFALVCLRQIDKATKWVVDRYQVNSDYVAKTEKAGFTQNEFNDFAAKVQNIRKDVYLFNFPSTVCCVISIFFGTLSLGIITFGWRKK